MGDLEKISLALNAAADCFFRGAEDFMHFHAAAAGDNEVQLAHGTQARILQTWGSALRAASNELSSLKETAN